MREMLDRIKGRVVPDCNRKHCGNRERTGYITTSDNIPVQPAAQTIYRPVKKQAREKNSLHSSSRKRTYKSHDDAQDIFTGCEKEKSNYITTHARHNPAHCLCPGLFRSLKRGERKHQKLDITYRHGNTMIRFWGPEPLGADDLRILQSVVALAGAKGRPLSYEPRTNIGVQMRSLLEITGSGGQVETKAVEATLARVLHEIGLGDSGQHRKQALASFDRLASITLVVDRGHVHLTSRVLSVVANKETGQIGIGLNPLLASAIIGIRHTRIEMSEVRDLAKASDAARLLHQRLSAVVDQGVTRWIGTDVLCGYVWPEHNVSATGTQRIHRHRIRSALAELGALSKWSVQIERQGQYLIHRKKITG